MRGRELALIRRDKASKDGRLSTPAMVCSGNIGMSSEEGGQAPSVSRAAPARRALALLPLAKRDGIGTVAQHQHGIGRFDPWVRLTGKEQQRLVRGHEIGGTPCD